MSILKYKRQTLTVWYNLLIRFISPNAVHTCLWRGVIATCKLIAFITGEQAQEPIVGCAAVYCTIFGCWKN